MPELVIESKTHGTHTVLFDEEDRKIIESYKWRVCQSRYTFYVIAHIPHPDGGWIEWYNPKRGRIQRHRRKTTCYLHRLILNATKSKVIDHIDGNGLNNTRKNLRLVSAMQNRRNTKKQSNNTSGYKGVYYSKKNKNWCSAVCHRGKNIYIGSYDTAEDAAKAYDAKIKELGWQIVNQRMLNFPEE
jgi:hypothetical protein